MRSSAISETLARLRGQPGPAFSQAQKDIGEIKISAQKAGQRALRLDRFDFDDAGVEDSGQVVPLTKPDA